MMKRCLEKGLSGQALDMFVQEVLADPSIDWQSLEPKYNSVYETDHDIPSFLFEKLKDKF